MGKAKRIKRERAQRRAPEPHAALNMASELIAYSYGSHADCAAAAALMVMTGKELGYTLTARSVSVLARQPSTGAIAFMGPRASALVAESDRSRAENHRAGDGDTGHMIVTADEPRVLIDVNVGQIRGYGMQAPDGITINIQSTDPENGQWIANTQDLELVYLPDDNDALWDRYRAGLSQLQASAHRLAQLIAGGASVDAIKQQITPKG